MLQNADYIDLLQILDFLKRTQTYLTLLYTRISRSLKNCNNTCNIFSRLSSILVLRVLTFNYGGEIFQRNYTGGKMVAKSTPFTYVKIVWKKIFF